MKGVSLPVNVVIIMVLGLIIVLGLAIFATSSITSSEGELSEQQVISECCTRACRDPSNFASSTSLSLVVCSAQGDPNWNAVKKYDRDVPATTVTLWEISNAKTSATTEAARVQFAKTMCSC